jgi:hypothetical protein
MELIVVVCMGICCNSQHEQAYIKIPLISTEGEIVEAEE